MQTDNQRNPLKNPATPEDIYKARDILSRLCKQGALTMSIPVQSDDEDMILLRVINSAALASRATPQPDNVVEAVAAGMCKCPCGWSGEEWERDPKKDEFCADCENAGEDCGEYEIEMTCPECGKYVIAEETPQPTYAEGIRKGLDMAAVVANGEKVNAEETNEPMNHTIRRLKKLLMQSAR